MGDVGDKAEDEQDVEPPGDLEVERDASAAGRPGRPSPARACPETTGGPLRVMSDGEGLEIEVAQGDRIRAK